MATKEHSTLTGAELHVTKDHQSEHVTGGDQIGTFGDSSRGLVPASGGGTTTFLRADHTFAAPSSGSGTWVGLTDTASSFAGQAGKYVKVNVGATALEFGTPSGSGDMTKAVYDSNDDGIFAIAQGGTGQSTAQSAMDAISQVSGATNEHVLTKDTVTGNATWKVGGGGGATAHSALTELNYAAAAHTGFAANPAVADLDMSNYFIKGIASIYANNNSVWMEIVGGTDYSKGPKIVLYGEDYVGDSAGGIRFRTPNVAKSAYRSAMEIEGVSDAPMVDIFYGLDMNSKTIANVLDPIADQDAATKKYVDDTTGSWVISGAELQMGTARGMGMQGEDILYTGDVVPQTNNLSNLGTASYLWANVFATNGIFGDLGFEEKECHICKEKFKVGDIIDLIIRSIESHGIMTVPVHKECNK